MSGTGAGSGPSSGPDGGAAGGRPGFRGRLRRFRPRTRPRYTGPSFNRLIPNILTLLGLCAGLTAIRFALDAQWEKAAVLIVVCAAIDALDGRLAREEPDVLAALDSPADESEGSDTPFDERAGQGVGRLVEPDEGARGDTEADLVATDAGTDLGGYTAEESAMHLEPEA